MNEGFEERGTPLSVSCPDLRQALMFYYCRRARWANEKAHGLRVDRFNPGPRACSRFLLHPDEKALLLVLGNFRARHLSRRIPSVQSVFLS